MERQNCWEHMRCGREPGGEHADAEGVCPAATEVRLDGVHGGVNGGRSCWAVVGTLSGRDPVCSGKGGEDCFNCGFYRAVLDDESPHLVFTPAIMSLLNGEESHARWLRGSD